MEGHLSLAQLKARVGAGSIDTVIVAAPDMQGRLVGKRFHAGFFLESGLVETHCCDYLIATDMEMTPVDGYAATSWSAGYGDYVMKPDLATLRLVPWLEGTALVLCDLLDHHTHELVPHAPRTILRNQLSHLKKRHKLDVVCATELEFFVFRESFEQMRDKGYAGMTPISPYNEDYHIFQTTKEEGLMRRIRNGLYGAGIKVENTKGEADAGQAEVNINCADALTTADNHVITKNAIKEMAFQEGHAVTFLAKWSHNAAGSSSHIHQSLSRNGKPVFYDPKAKHGMSATMRHYLAGLLAHADEITYCLAPYVNSYKRFARATFAPTKAIWSVDNRTAGYRIAGPDTKSVRVECRIGGSDLNPYLALAAQLAAGMAGVHDKLKLEDEFQGDAYSAANLREIPGTLRAATDAFAGSKMLRQAFGDAVVDHYAHAARWEQEDFDNKVTDYEVVRGFERA